MILLNMQDARPIYQQIIDGIKEQVVRGILIQGDQIPSIRQLAATLTVTPNTVSKAYQELEREGVIISVRGKGNYINKLPKVMGEKKMVEMKQLLQKICIEWQYTGYTKEDLVQMIQEVYQEIEGEKQDE